MQNLTNWGDDSFKAYVEKVDKLKFYYVSLNSCWNVCLKPRSENPK